MYVMKLFKFSIKSQTYVIKKSGSTTIFFFKKYKLIHQTSFTRNHFSKSNRHCLSCLRHQYSYISFIQPSSMDLSFLKLHGKYYLIITYQK